jgi:hypothetical protein
VLISALLKKMLCAPGKEVRVLPLAQCTIADGWPQLPSSLRVRAKLATT